MIKLLTLTLALFAVLSVTTCGGGASSPTDLPNNTLPQQNQNDPVTTPNGGDASQPITYVDGGFKHIFISSGPSDNTQTKFGLYAVGIAFYGDTSGVNPDFTNLRIFVDGELIDTSYTIDVDYYAEGGFTTYRYELPTTFDSINGITHFVVTKNTQEAFDTTFFEIDYKGTTLRFGDDLTEFRETFNILTGDVTGNIG
ncbi:MAG: hypothetical protein FWD44_09890 [Oscillospiraceae bacterium]|nr:hypothetical protein [Oscillospiraceae bacterium]